jgi:cell wall-associated NlpC family hydrolase
MNEQLNLALEEARQPFADTRFNVCQLEIVESDGRYRLEGTVLDEPTLDAVLTHLRQRMPDMRWEHDGVRVLRQAKPRLMAVATNLTGWQREPSWLAEQQSQVLNGTPVEILEEGERWSFGRLEDGYLGYVYTGYLGSAVGAAEPTHIISAPIAHLRREPDAAAPLVGRAFAGTRVAAAGRAGGWMEVTLVGGLCGYVPASDLRAPANEFDRDATRARLIADAHRYMGVPYLWGGTSAHGIDCSGFAQLMHKLAGITIPRDADSQFYAGPAVEPPYAAGDLLYFGAKNGHRSVTHVGISLGPDRDKDGMVMIHSGRARNGVYIDDINAVDSLRASFLGGRRFLKF